MRDCYSSRISLRSLRRLSHNSHTQISDLRPGVFFFTEALVTRGDRDRFPSDKVEILWCYWERAGRRNQAKLRKEKQGARSSEGRGVVVSIKETFAPHKQFSTSLLWMLLTWRGRGWWELLSLHSENYSIFNFRATETTNFTKSNDAARQATIWLKNTGREEVAAFCCKSVSVNRRERVTDVIRVPLTQLLSFIWCIIEGRELWRTNDFYHKDILV